LGDLVNLNRARKIRARLARRQQADVNAARFGRSHADRALDAARTGIEAARLDGHRIEPAKAGREDGPQPAPGTAPTSVPASAPTSAPTSAPVIGPATSPKGMP